MRYQFQRRAPVIAAGLQRTEQCREVHSALTGYEVGIAHAVTVSQMQVSHAPAQQPRVIRRILPLYERHHHIAHPEQMLGADFIQQRLQHLRMGTMVALIGGQRLQNDIVIQMPGMFRKIQQTPM